MPNEANPFDQFTPGEQQQLAPQQGQSGQATASQQQQGNPFDQFTPGQNSTPTQPQPTKQEEDAGAFMAGVENFNRSFGKMAEGVILGTLKTGATIGSYLGGGQEMANYASDINNNSAVGQYSKQQQQSADAAAKLHPTAAAVGTFTGEVLRTVPAMVAAGGGTVIAQLAKGALANAGVNALDIAPDTTTKIKQIMEGGALGMIGTAGGLLAGKALQGIGMAVKDTGGVLSKLIPSSLKDTPVEYIAPDAPRTASTLFTKLLTPKKAAIGDIAQEVSLAGRDVVEANGKAAKNIGYSLSPAEQIGTESARTMEGKTLLESSVTKQRLAESQAANKETLASSLYGTIEKLVPEGVEATTAKRDALFTGLKDVELTKDQWGSLLENPTIGKYIDHVNKNVDLPSSYEGLTMTNVYKLNSISKAMYDDLYKKATSVTKDATKSLNSDELKALTEARDKLHTVLNEATGGKYGEAQALAQQLILKRNINKSIAEINKAPGQTSVSLSQVYDKLFPNEESANIFAKMVSDTGGNPTVTKDLITVLNQVKNSPVNQILARPAGVSPTQVGGRNIGIAERYVLKLIKGRYNKAMANLIANGNWQPEVAKALDAASLPKKVSNLAMLAKEITDITEKHGAKAAGIGAANQGKGVLSQLEAQQEENPQSPLPKGYMQ